MKAKKLLALYLILLMTLTGAVFSSCGAELAASAAGISAGAEDAAEDAQGAQDADEAQDQQAAEQTAQQAGQQETGQQTQQADQQKGTGDPHYDSSDFLADIPEYAGYAFCYVNGNKPDFREDEIWKATQESLDPLDDLGRCGTANSCIGRDGMPTEGRGDISEVHPTGWHTDRYDFVEGEALYNRCHLIAHQLSGDDAVPRNLITGTSYMNRDGMLPFEVTIGDYVRATGNHVMYRVTPIFSGDELIARGVHMQAISVEDGGEDLAFNVYCYNVQPGIDIDYKTGDNELSEDKTLLEDYQAGKFAMTPNTLGVIPDAEGTAAASEEAQAPASGDGQNDGNSHEVTYVLNTNTHKFHYPDCKSVNAMKDKNKEYTSETRDEVINRGYDPCGNCHP